MVNLNFVRLSEEAIIPTQAYSTDAGIDFYANHKVYSAESIIKVATGIAWEPSIELLYPNNATWLIKANFNIYMQIEDKSGFSTRTGLHVIGGVIDQNYRGEIVICFRNDSMNNVYIKKGEMIAQGIVKLVPKVSVREVDSVNETDRGQKGFGSTG